MSEEAWRGEATNTAWRERIGRAGACREVREADAGRVGIYERAAANLGFLKCHWW
jgi:hypothetical protein